VWTIPKRLRIYFRHDRPLLGRLAYLAWETIIETDRDLTGDRDALPGMIAGIQTFGELLHFAQPRKRLQMEKTSGVYRPDNTGKSSEMKPLRLCAKTRLRLTLSTGTSVLRWKKNLYSR
jgi:hypothetical protein